MFFLYFCCLCCCYRKTNHTRNSQIPYQYGYRMTTTQLTFVRKIHTVRYTGTGIDTGLQNPNCSLRALCLYTSTGIRYCSPPASSCVNGSKDTHGRFAIQISGFYRGPPDRDDRQSTHRGKGTTISSTLREKTGVTEDGASPRHHHHHHPKYGIHRRFERETIKENRFELLVECTPRTVSSHFNRATRFHY